MMMMYGIILQENLHPAAGLAQYQSGISPAQRIFPTSDDGKKNEQSDIKTFESYYNVTNEKDLHKELKSN